MFWNSNKTRPIPNSIAEKTKKKKVRDRMLRLSYIKPIKRTRVYKVIHKSSAVSNKCKAVLVFITMLNIIRKKKKNNMFKLSTIIFYNK